MARGATRASRFDPYKNFKFQVIWDGRVVAGISRISGLKRTTDVVQQRDGGAAISTRQMPGRTGYEAITLERGITHDSAFEDWANIAAHSDPTSATGPTEFRKEVSIELHTESGTLLRSYKIHRAWVSEYVVLVDLDAQANAVAIEQVKLEHEGWERDSSVVEPVEKSTKGSRRT